MYIILHYLPSSYLFSVPGEVHLYFAVLSQLPVLAEFPLHPAPQDIPLTELQVLTGDQPLLAANTVKKIHAWLHTINKLLHNTHTNDHHRQNRHMITQPE